MMQALSIRDDQWRSRGAPLSGEEAMAPMVVQHRVRDYATWRLAYDAHEANRVGAGITDGRVAHKLTA